MRGYIVNITCLHIQVLCWGVRNMKKYQLASCTSPSALIEIGGYTIETNVIKNTKKNPNFAKNAFFKDIVSIDYYLKLVFHFVMFSCVEQKTENQ